jgi:hypothetical protein
MNLGDAVAYNFIAVAKKVREVPALGDVIQSGKLQVQKARKITPVLNQENKDFWLKLAVEHPQKVVEKEVARVRPQAAKPERVTYISATRLNLSVNISENTHELLGRVQDLESQRTRSAASREQAIEESLKAYLEKHDPLEKAKRSQARAEKSNAIAPVARQEKFRVQHVKSQTRNERQYDARETRQNQARKRHLYPASLEHQINLRDLRQCTETDSTGQRCQEKRWLEFHHVIPLEMGGQDTLENMTTLCWAHHRLLHHFRTG